MARGALPQSLEAERSVLGAILLSPSSLHRVADLVCPEAFFHPAHSAIMTAMLALDGSSRPIDAVTVAEQLRALDLGDKLRGVGGEGYFAELVSGAITAENIAYHAQIVRRKWTARRVLEAAHEIVARGYAENDSDEGLAEEALALISAVAQSSATGGYVSAAKGVADAYRGIEARNGNPQIVSGVRPKLAELAQIVPNFRGGDMVIVGGRPSMGKSSLGLQLALDASIDQQIPALVFSLEMSIESLFLRGLSSWSGIDGKDLAAGRVLKSQWTPLLTASTAIGNAPLWIDETARTMAEIRARAQRWRANAREGGGKDALVVIDYLQLIQQPTTARRNGNREQDVSEISRGVKNLASELRCPVLALSQLSRNCEARPDKRPRLSDLRESGSLEQDADVVIFVYRGAVYDGQLPPEDAEVIVAKQRNGPLGIANVRWDAPTTTFFDRRASQ